MALGYPWLLFLLAIHVSPGHRMGRASFYFKLGKE